MYFTHTIETVQALQNDIEMYKYDLDRCLHFKNELYAYLLNKRFKSKAVKRLIKEIEAFNIHFDKSPIKQ